MSELLDAPRSRYHKPKTHITLDYYRSSPPAFSVRGLICRQPSRFLASLKLNNPSLEMFFLISRPHSCIQFLYILLRKFLVLGNG
jgi:hypothetical protein